jgi:uncharacterized membrane protein YkvA (DUF1232 family)
MLQELVEQKVAEIRRLDVERDAVAFAGQVLARNPEPFRGIPRPVAEALASRDVPDAEPADRRGARLLARAQLRLILELSDHAAEMLALVHDGHTSPHVRVALSGSLAYLVQPAELVPDDAPGGYGYVDDCIVIKTMRLALARMGVPLVLDEGRELRALSLLALALAPADFTSMQSLVTRTWNETHLLHMTPTSVAVTQAQRLYRFPLEVRYDWSTPMPSITHESPTLCRGRFGGVRGEEFTIDLGEQGVVYMTAAGEIRGYEQGPGSSTR